jgi:hypothetical protein
MEDKKMARLTYCANQQKVLSLIGKKGELTHRNKAGFTAEEVKSWSSGRKLQERNQEG